MGAHDAFGFSSVLHTAGHLLLLALIVVSALCIGFTIYGVLTTARGRSQPW